MDLTLSEHFKSSQLDTIVFSGGGWGKTEASAKAFVVEYDRDFRSPPPEIISIEQIRSIRFENFRALDLPSVFTTLCEMPKLDELYFSRCEIKSIPPEIGKMRRLRRLTFDFNTVGNIKSWEIRPVPPEFGDLENLQELGLIDCSCFYKGFPRESSNLRNLKTVIFTDKNSTKTLPENIESLPVLEHLYLSGGKIQPSDLERIINGVKTLKSISIKSSFHRFEELASKYPHVEFFNDGVKFGAQLASLVNQPEKLPKMREWLSENRSEAAQAQYAFLLMKKHFARGGLELGKTDVPATFSSFGWEFYVNVSPLLRQSEHASMLRDFFAELTDFCEAIHGEYFASALLAILERFIDRDPPLSLIVPLLPANALAQLGEMNAILDRRYESNLEIQNQMGY